MGNLGKQRETWIILGKRWERKHLALRVPLSGGWNGSAWTSANLATGGVPPMPQAYYVFSGRRNGRR